MARKKDRTPKANPQARRRTLLTQVGMEPTDELLKMPWGDFTAKIEEAGGNTTKPKRTPRKSGKTKTLTVTIGDDVVVPTNVKPPDPKSEEKKPRTKPKVKSKKSRPLKTPAPPPPPRPAAAATSPVSKPAANPFAKIFGAGAEPVKKKAPKTFFGKKNPKGQMGAMVAQQRQSPQNLANTTKQVSNWLGRVGQVVKREVAATVSDVNRISAPRTRTVTGRPSSSGPQMTNVRSAPAVSAPAPVRSARPSSSAGPQMTNVRSTARTRPSTVNRRIPLFVTSGPAKKISQAAAGLQFIGKRGYPVITQSENRAHAKALSGAIRRGPAQGGRASVVERADPDFPVRASGPPVSREIKSVKTSPFRVSAAHGWNPSSARFAQVASPMPTLPGTGDRIGLYGFLRDNRRQAMGGGNFRDRAPVVRDIKPPANRSIVSMSGSGMGSGSPAQPTTPTGRPKKTTYKPPTLSPPIHAEKARQNRVTGGTVTRPATPPSSVPSDVHSPKPVSTDATGRTVKPQVIFRSEKGNFATRSGREVSVFGAGSSKPIFVTPVSPKESVSSTRLPTKKIDWAGFGKDLISDLETDWAPDDLRRRSSAVRKDASGIAKATSVKPSKAVEVAERRAVAKMAAKYPDPFLTRASWLGGGAQNVNLPSTMGSKTGRAKTGLVNAMKSRGLLGLAGGAAGTGIGVAIDVLASPDRASAKMSPKAEAENRAYLKRRENVRRSSLAAAQKVFPTFTQSGYGRRK